MNLDQAYQILDYQAVPKNREEQIGLIRIMGYTRLRGGNLLQDCHDRQLLRVAQRLFKKAGDKVQAELHTQLKEINDQEDLIHYHSFLCDSFNIPAEDRDQYAISQLEGQLMQ